MPVLPPFSPLDRSASPLISPHRRLLGGILALILGIASSGCTPVALGRASQSNQVLVGVLSDPKTFNYALNQESPNIFSWTYEGLIATHGITSEVIPAAAESWEISDDQRTITFTLREGLRWSDGAPLTAEDVVFTFNEIYFNEAIPTDSRDILRVGDDRVLPTITALDDRRIQVQVPEPFAPLLRNLGLPILPKHKLAEAVRTLDSEGNPKFISMWGNNTDPKEIVCNGPFVLESYSTSQQVVFKKNPYYWKKDDQGNSLPYLDRYRWRIVENQNTGLLKFRSGELDSFSLRPEDFALLKKQEKIGNFTIYTGGPAPGTNFIAFNLNQAKRNGKPLVDPIKSRWFRTLAFRQAVAYAIDRQGLIDTVYRGLAVPIYSHISVQSPYYLSPEEGLPTYSYDPEKAKQLLLEAGFTYTPQGQLLDWDQNPVEFSLITNSGNLIRENTVARIKQDLERIGMKVNVSAIAFNLLVDKLDQSLDWEAHLLGFTGGVEPSGGANIWQPDGGLHTFNQSKPDLQGWTVSDWEKQIGQLYIEGARELDETKRKAIYGEAQKLAQEQVPFIQLINQMTMVAVRNKFQEIQFSDLEGPFWNLDELQLKLQP
ncbi:MAG: ABC transporter substrate-binding protein [Prochlorotrichaceae cyanobacterium]|jgi:peptide/nickel transport system substrate-binding protein